MSQVLKYAEQGGLLEAKKADTARHQQAHCQSPAEYPSTPQWGQEATDTPTAGLQAAQRHKTLR